MLVKKEIPNIVNLSYEDIGLAEEPETVKIEPAEKKKEEKKPMMPIFEWPPPKASAYATVPSELLTKKNKQTTLKDVAKRLDKAFNKAGYREKSWYYTPNGFAIVTRLEQMYPDGRPKESKIRFAPKVEPITEFSPSSYVKALLKPRTGQYRIFVAIVTSHPFPQDVNATLTMSQAMHWLPRGLNQFPNDLGKDLFTDKHTCTILIYEFEKTTSDHKTIFKENSELDGTEQLQKAKIWYWLVEK